MSKLRKPGIGWGRNAPLKGGEKRRAFGGFPYRKGSRRILRASEQECFRVLLALGIEGDPTVLLTLLHPSVRLHKAPNASLTVH